MPNVNTDSFYQAATLLADVVHQATGQEHAIPTSTGEFVSVATTALQIHRDPIMQALTQMWGRTIFAVRNYTAKFLGLEMDAERWGNVTRKISFADRDVQPDQRYIWPAGYDASRNPPNGNGNSVDMWAIHKDDPLQVQFYGQSVYQDPRTEFINSLDAAFRGPEEFLQYNAAAVRERQNKLAQYRENIGRAVLLNLMGTLLHQAADEPLRVIHLLTEYNIDTGLQLTRTTVMQPDNYAGFMRWVYARIATLQDMFACRSSMYQTRIMDKNINRHTEPRDTKIYILSKHLHQMDSMSKSVTFHADLLKLADVEAVPFWQAIDTPDKIDLRNTVSFTDPATGAVATATVAAEGTLSNPIFGVMFDRDACGYSIINRFDWATPGINAAGGYYNTIHHANIRTIQDTTEKAVLLMFD